MKTKLKLNTTPKNSLYIQYPLKKRVSIEKTNSTALEGNSTSGSIWSKELEALKTSKFKSIDLAVESLTETVLKRMSFKSEKEKELVSNQVKFLLSTDPNVLNELQCNKLVQS